MRANDNKMRENDDSMYVWGKRLFQNLEVDTKEYVWKIPRSWIISGKHKFLKQGDKIVAQTQHGARIAVVTKIGNMSENLDESLPGNKIPSVLKNLNAYKNALKEYDPELATMLGY